jgi:hypothetical protein
MPSLSVRRFGVLLLQLMLQPSSLSVMLLGGLPLAGAVCPNCHGSFTSCDFDTSGTCAGVTAVATNAASIAAGTGMLTLKGLIKPRFMQILSQVSTEAILALCKRPEPGTPFAFDASVTGMKVLGAINMGQITYDYAAASIMHLIDGVDVAGSTATAQIAKYRGILESLKSKSTGTTGALVETGVMSYLWAKISEFVIKRKMTTKLLFDSMQGGAASSSSATQLGATLHRPKSMEDFAEMMNLFVMMAFSLGLASAVVTTDFFQHVVYDTLRVHNRCWMIAHELLMIMFRLIEDSGGRLTFGNCYDEKYLNTVLEEAETNKVVFFRSLGGNPSITAGDKITPGAVQAAYTGKFTPDAKKCCFLFNSGKKEHVGDCITLDGTCRRAHACSQWVTGKGKYAQCRGSHPKSACTNADRCDEPVK